MSLAFIDMPGARPWPPRVSAFTKAVLGCASRRAPDHDPGKDVRAV